MEHILVVEDNLAQREAIAYALEKEGYGVTRVETGPLAQIVESPQHPYTQGLLASTIHSASGVTICVPVTW